MWYPPWSRVISARARAQTRFIRAIFSLIHKRGEIRESQRALDTTMCVECNILNNKYYFMSLNIKHWKKKSKLLVSHIHPRATGQETHGNYSLKFFGNFLALSSRSRRDVRIKCIHTRRDHRNIRLHRLLAVCAGRAGQCNCDLCDK